MESLHHPPEQKEPPEFFPTIIMHKKLGEHLSDFDVDLHAINKTFLENGLTEEEINDTTIVFAGKMPRVSREGNVTQGRYKAKQRQLDNFPARRIKRRLEWFADAEDEEKRDYYLKNMGRHLGWDLSETLRHEMEHHIVRVNGGMPEQKSLDKRQKVEMIGILSAFGAGNFVLTDLYEYLNPSETIGQVAISQSIITTLLTTFGMAAMVKQSKRYYEKSPEESQARKAAEEDFFYVTTRYKVQDEHPITQSS